MHFHRVLEKYSTDNFDLLKYYKYPVIAIIINVPRVKWSFANNRSYLLKIVSKTF